MEQHHQKAPSQADERKQAASRRGESIPSEGPFDAAMKELTAREWQELASQRRPLTPEQQSIVQSAVRKEFAKRRDTKQD